MAKRQFTLDELRSDPAAAAAFLSAFIRSEYGWDEDDDPELPSTANESPLDIAREIAAGWVRR